MNEHTFSFRSPAFKALCLSGAVLLFSCDQSEWLLSHANTDKPSTDAPSVVQPTKGKPVIYQVFTRLFGNKNSTNKPWGSLEENGVGKIQ